MSNESPETGSRTPNPRHVERDVDLWFRAFKTKPLYWLSIGLVCAALAVAGWFLKRVETFADTAMQTAGERAGNDVYEWARSRFLAIREADDANAETSPQEPAQLVAFSGNLIIPDVAPLTPGAEIKWNTAAVERITESEIAIRLPDATLESTIRLSAITVVVPNRPGASTDAAFDINGWRASIKILETSEKGVIALVGYKHNEG